jgi:D-xylose transport system permease protein
MAEGARLGGEAGAAKRLGDGAGTPGESTDSQVDASAAGGAGAIGSLVRLVGRRRGLAQFLPLMASLVAVGVIFQILSGLFLDPRNLGNLFTEAAPLALVAVASTLMIVMGEIDLSLGSVAGLIAAICADVMSHGAPWWVAVAAALVGSLLIGTLHGLIVVFANVRSFVVTLAGFLIWYGVQLMILRPAGYIAVDSPFMRSLATARLPSSFSGTVVVVIGALWILGDIMTQRGRAARGALAFGLLTRLCVIVLCILALLYLGQGGGLPIMSAIVVAITACVWLALAQTAPGRHLYAIGSNMFAAKEHGVRVELVKFYGFLATSFLAGVAGLSLASYTAGADNSTGTGTLLLAGIGACVIGGVSLAGGRGSVWGALGGALLLGGVQNGLNLLNLSIDLVYIVEGAVVVAVLLVDAAVRRQLLSR